jgi:hypothetical protein
MKNYLLLVCIALPFAGFAQTKSSEARHSDNSRIRTEEVENGYDVYTFNSRDKSAKGTPMLSSRWQPAEILLVGNTKRMSAPVKYDIYQHQLQVRRAQGDSILVPATRVQEFSFAQLDAHGAERPRRFVRYESPALPAGLNGTCAEVLYNGKSVQLLKFWNKQLVKEAENTTNFSSTGTVQRYDENNKYYVRWVGDGQLLAVRPKRGSLKEALAGHPEALRALEAQKGPLSSEAELQATIGAIDKQLGTE